MAYAGNICRSVCKCAGATRSIAGACSSSNNTVPIEEEEEKGDQQSERKGSKGVRAFAACVRSCAFLCVCECVCLCLYVRACLCGCTWAFSVSILPAVFRSLSMFSQLSRSRRSKVRWTNGRMLVSMTSSTKKYTRQRFGEKNHCFESMLSKLMLWQWYYPMQIIIVEFCFRSKCVDAGKNTQKTKRNQRLASH